MIVNLILITIIKLITILMIFKKIYSNNHKFKELVVFSTNQIKLLAVFEHPNPIKP
jgi:hypothetical protein